MTGQSGEDGFLSLRETLPGEDEHRSKTGAAPELKYVRLLLTVVLLPSVLTEVA